LLPLLLPLPEWDHPEEFEALLTKLRVGPVEGAGTGHVGRDDKGNSSSGSKDV